MGVWLVTVVGTGLAVLGMTMGVLTMPAAERPVRNEMLQKSGAQSRIAFELLVRDYLKRNSTFVGVLSPADLRAAGVSSSSLANGSFAPGWYATVAAGGLITFCAGVPARARPAMLNMGFDLESLTCAS